MSTGAGTIRSRIAVPKSNKDSKRQSLDGRDPSIESKLLAASSSSSSSEGMALALGADEEETIVADTHRGLINSDEEVDYGEASEGEGDRTVPIIPKMDLGADLSEIEHAESEVDIPLTKEDIAAQEQAIIAAGRVLKQQKQKQAEQVRQQKKELDIADSLIKQAQYAAEKAEGIALKLQRDNKALQQSVIQQKEITDRKEFEAAEAATTLRANFVELEKKRKLAEAYLTDALAKNAEQERKLREHRATASAAFSLSSAPSTPGNAVVAAVISEYPTFVQVNGSKATICFHDKTSFTLSRVDMFKRGVNEWAIRNPSLLPNLNLASFFAEKAKVYANDHVLSSTKFGKSLAMCRSIWEIKDLTKHDLFAYLDNIPPEALQEKHRLNQAKADVLAMFQTKRIFHWTEDITNGIDLLEVVRTGLEKNQFTESEQTDHISGDWGKEVVSEATRFIKRESHKDANLMALLEHLMETERAEGTFRLHSFQMAINAKFRTYELSAANLKMLRGEPKQASAHAISSESAVQTESIGKETDNVDAHTRHRDGNTREAEDQAELYYIQDRSRQNYAKAAAGRGPGQKSVFEIKGYAKDGQDGPYYPPREQQKQREQTRDRSPASYKQTVPKKWQNNYYGRQQEHQPNPFERERSNSRERDTRGRSPSNDSVGAGKLLKREPTSYAQQQYLKKVVCGYCGNGSHNFVDCRFEQLNHCDINPMGPWAGSEMCMKYMQAGFCSLVTGRELKNVQGEWVLALTNKGPQRVTKV